MDCAVTGALSHRKAKARENESVGQTVSRMKKLRKLLVPLILVAAAAGAYYYSTLTPSSLTLTGIVTTNDVIVSSQIAGQISQLLLKEGDSVKANQLAAVIVPDELKADTAYYEQNAAGLSSQVRESEATLRLEQRQTTDQIQQAQSMLASAQAQHEAAKADLESARVTYTRTQRLADQKIAAAQELDMARTARDAAQSKVDSLARQVEAQQSAVALARANAEQVAARRSGVEASQHQQAAAAAQRTKADVRLRYTEIHAPIDGIVDTRAVRGGEVRHARAADPDADQSRRPVGARRRRGNLHRSRADRRHAHGAAAVGRGAQGHGLLPRRGRRLSPRSATSAAPSATSRPSRSGSASTTPTAGSPSA